MQTSRKLVVILLSPVLASLLSVATPADALDIGVQFASSGDVGANKQQCSRKCESTHCIVPPFMRYGKYCGILYSGCPGEKPCDALDACCMAHDACVAKQNDYLSEECNQNFLNCIEDARKAGKRTFKGNNCTVEEVADAMTMVIEAAVLAGKVFHWP